MQTVPTPDLTKAETGFNPSTADCGLTSPSGDSDGCTNLRNTELEFSSDTMLTHAGV